MNTIFLPRDRRENGNRRRVRITLTKDSRGQKKEKGPGSLQMGTAQYVFAAGKERLTESAK